jgi:hypothetical protein
MEGLVFDPRPDLWDIRALHGRMLCRFDDIPGAHRDLARSFKAVLAALARVRSLSYVDGTYWRFRTMMAFIASTESSPIREVTSTHLMNFRSDAPHNEYVLGGLRAFLRMWHRRGDAGVAPDAIRFLAAARLRPNPRGVAVATMDPRTGPLSDLELQGTLEALTKAFANREVSLAEYLIAMFFMLFAPRPIQLAAMKCSDFIVATSDAGAKSYMLRVPRAKQRRRPRRHFTIRPIPPEVGELVALYVREVTAAWVARGESSESAPMFPVPRSSTASVQTPLLRGHAASRRLSRSIIRTLANLAPISERTGERIVLNALRFRRTLGTRALAAGYGLKVIAGLLDHSDLQSVRVYAGLRPGIYERIHKATVFELAPLVAAFQGIPVTTLAPGLRRITDPHADRSMRRPVGCCGTARTCDFAAPVACYTCESFRPWLDGPHEAMYERLIREQDRIRESCGEEMAATLNRTIYAAAEVVMACRAHRRERKR